MHLNWWGQPIPRGLLQAKAALVLNTSNTETQREQQVFGNPLERIWQSCVFDLCGVRKFRRQMFNVVVVSSVEQRQTWLREVRELVRNLLADIQH